MNRILTLILALCVSAMSAETGGKVGLSFLKIGVDARAVAMGDAYSSIASDASAAYWNPAGLATARSNSVLFMHNSWFQGINQEFASIQFLNGKHNLAVSLNMLSVTGIELRGETATEVPDGETEALNTYVGLAYATTLFSDWQIGVQLKYLYEKYYFYSADGMALDLGIKKQNILPDLTWGAAIQNLGKMSVLKNDATALPILFRTGVNYTLPFNLLDYRPRLAADIVSVANDATNFNLGFETRVAGHIDLRLGYIIGSESQSFSGGFGLIFGVFNFAYAFVPFNYDLGNSHLFSLIVDF